MKKIWEMNDLFVSAFTPYQQYFSYLTFSQTSPGFYVSVVKVF